MNPQRHLAGISLVETSIYIGLLSMFLTGAFITTMLISESIRKYEDLAILTQESTFISHHIRESIPHEIPLREKIPTRFFIADFSVTSHDARGSETPKFFIVEFTVTPSPTIHTPQISTRLFYYPDAP